MRKFHPPSPYLIALAGIAGAGVTAGAKYFIQSRARRAHRSAISLPPGIAENIRPWVVFNPSKHEDPQAFRNSVTMDARALGVRDIHFLETTIEDPGVSQARKAVRAGATHVIAAGGDGTVRAVAAGLAHTGVRMGILPEGTRRGKTDRVPSIHAGVSVIARMAKVPILPMTVRGVERIKQKGQRVHFPKVTVDYGDPILVGDFDFLPKDERVEACTWYAMRECFALSLNVPREQVDMPALFPGGKDFTAVFAEHPVPHHTTAEVVAGIEAKAAAKAAKAAKVQEIA